MLERHARPAIGAQQFTQAGNQKQQTGATGLDDVAQTIRSTIAAPFGDDQCPRIQDPGDARRVAARRRITRSVPALRPEQYEGGLNDELFLEAVKLAVLFLDRQFARHADQFYQLFGGSHKLPNRFSTHQLLRKLTTSL